MYVIFIYICIILVMWRMTFHCFICFHIHWNDSKPWQHFLSVVFTASSLLWLLWWFEWVLAWCFWLLGCSEWLLGPSLWCFVFSFNECLRYFLSGNCTLLFYKQHRLRYSIIHVLQRANSFTLCAQLSSSDLRDHVKLF